MINNIIPLQGHKEAEMARTLKDIRKLIEDEGIKMVDFKLTDIDGRWRHLSIPAERLTESKMEH